MYIPPSHAESRPEVLFDYMEAHPLAALVTASPADGLFATHLPLVVHRDRGAQGVLEGHVARASVHHRHAGADGSLDALVIFSGPDAYISPSWYASKTEHGRVVPTWNYVAVHVYGTLRFVDDAAFLRRHLDELVTRHEATRPAPWAVSDAPADYVAQQAQAIVGVEVTIARLEGKWKMSQNRSSADIDGVIGGLAGSPSPDDRAVAEIVRERRPPRK